MGLFRETRKELKDCVDLATNFDENIKKVKGSVEELDKGARNVHRSRGAGSGKQSNPGLAKALTDGGLVDAAGRPLVTRSGDGAGGSSGGGGSALGGPPTKDLQFNSGNTGTTTSNANTTAGFNVNVPSSGGSSSGPNSGGFQSGGSVAQNQALAWLSYYKLDTTDKWIKAFFAAAKMRNPEWRGGMIVVIPTAADVQGAYLNLFPTAPTRQNTDSQNALASLFPPGYSGPTTAPNSGSGGGSGFATNPSSSSTIGSGPGKALGNVTTAVVASGNAIVDEIRGLRRDMKDNGGTEFRRQWGANA